MKKYLLVWLLLAAGATYARQTTLSGYIQPVGQVQLTQTYDGNFWKKATELIQPAASGYFVKTFNGAATRWLWIGEDARRKIILLSPGRPLQVTLKNNALFFSGAAAKENTLISWLELESTQQLPFIKELGSDGGYARSPIDSVIRFKFPQIIQLLDSVRRVVKQARLPVAVERTVQTELTYHYANAVTGDLTYWLNRGQNREGFHLRFIDTIQAYFPVPAKEELAISPAANRYLERLFRMRLWKAFYVYQADKDRGRADSQFLRTTGISMAVLQSERQRESEMLLFSKRLKGLLPAYAWEKALNNLLYNLCMSGQVQGAAGLLQFIQKHSSDGRLVKDAEAMYAPLRKARDQYAGNLNIRIRKDYRSVSTLDSLLAPYKGKVVFIDLWGTWCPYCISDMEYEPVLKKQLEEKDIVFLYLAQDEDKDDEKWRDFIFANNLTGEHVRKNQSEIGMIWNALGVPEKEWSYPRYLVADRSGRIVVGSAARPGKGDELYRQLLQVLNE